jgi:hypothetical protein
LLNLIDWMLEHPSSPVISVFDPDDSHRTLTRACDSRLPGGLKPPHVFETMNWRTADEKHLVLDKMIRIICAPAQASPEPVPSIAILDGVANQMADVLFWADELNLFELGKDMGFRVTFLLCVNDVGDSTLAARDLVEHVGNRADYIVIRNMKGQGPDGTLSWDACETRRRVLNELGGGEMTIDGFTKDLAVMSDPPNIPGFERQPPKSLLGVFKHGDTVTRSRALKKWDELSRRFDSVERLLLPPAMWRAVEGEDQE